MLVNWSGLPRHAMVILHDAVRRNPEAVWAVPCGGLRPWFRPGTLAASDTMHHEGSQHGFRRRFACHRDVLLVLGGSCPLRHRVGGGVRDGTRVMTAEPSTPGDAQPDQRLARRVPVWLRVAISVVLVGALAWYVDLRQVGRILASSRLDLVGCVLLLMAALRVLSAYRWFILMRAGRPDIRFMSIVRISFISVFAGTFLPGGVGGEAIRIYGAARASSDLALAFSSAVVERAFGMLALLVMVTAGLSLGPPGLPEVLRSWSLAGLLALAVAAWLAMAEQPRTHVLGALSRYAVLDPVTDRLRKLYDRFRLFADGSVLLWSLVLAFLLQLGRVLATYLTAQALGVEVGLATLLVIVPAALLVSALPISIGGLGVREGTMVSLFSMVGVAPAAGLAISVLLLATGFATTLPGAVFLAQMRALRDRSG